ncbi:hypothetical protein PybrP1_011212 [[Pythium] brassicae (nom. inval.)]|nr:hypothetical protein PybrP1_011212 [[Pythium] brassicae (nom. inval.)]
MAAPPSGSYYNEYMRANALLKHGHEQHARRLLTDRGAYISFLEVQLERVSAACLAAQSFEQRVAALETARAVQETQLAALSSVARLSQEFAEQSAEQTQRDVRALDERSAEWTEKLSREVREQHARADAADAQLRRCEDAVQQLAERDAVAQELDDLRALVFALETRLEGMQSSSVDTDKHLAFLKDLVTDRFDKELEIVRTSVSEKCFTMEGKLKRLREELQSLPQELETSWRADLARVQSAQDERACALRDEVERTSEQQARDQSETKGLLRKCLDTQHLLSASVVAIQNEVDEQTQSASPVVSSAIDGLRENQYKLKDALRLLQTCAQQAQQESRDRCRELAERQHAAEDALARLAEESQGQADELASVDAISVARTRTLVTLGEVEQKLRHDADSVAEHAVRSVRVESESHFKQIMEFTSAMENRLRILERGFLRPTTPDHHARPSPEHARREAMLQNRILELEERLHRKAQSEEEHRALFASQRKSELQPPSSSSVAPSSQG